MRNLLAPLVGALLFVTPAMAMGKAPIVPPYHEQPQPPAEPVPLPRPKPQPKPKQPKPPVAKPVPAPVCPPPVVIEKPVIVEKPVVMPPPKYVPEPPTWGVWVRDIIWAALGGLALGILVFVGRNLWRGYRNRKQQAA